MLQTRQWGNKPPHLKIKQQKDRKSALNRNHTKEDIQIGTNHMKICSLLFLIKLLVKSTLRYCTIPIWIAALEKKWQCQMLVGICSYRNSHSLLGDCKTMRPLWKSVWQFLSWNIKLHIALSYNPAIAVLGIFHVILKFICKHKSVCK